MGGVGRGVRVPRAGAVALAVGLFLVAGCTPEDPAPTPSPTVESPTPTASPTPSVEAVAPPERPAEMERSDEAGAAAAATFFMRSFGYLLQSGDTAAWDEFSGQTCGFCEQARSRASDIYGSGHQILGGELSVGAVAVLGHDEVINVYAVEVDYAFAEGERVDAEGVAVEHLEAEVGTAVLDVAPSTRGWVLIEGSGGS